MWNKVTLKQFHQLSDIETSEDDNASKVFKRLKVLGYEPTSQNIGGLLSKDLSWINKLPSEELQKTYIIDGQEYYVYLDFIRMTPARFLDLIHQVKGKDPKDVSEWAYLVSLLLSQPGEPYDYSTHLNRAELFYEKMTFDQVYPIVCFFLNVWKHLQEIILDSSMEKLRTQVQELIRTYKENTESLQTIGGGSAT